MSENKTRPTQQAVEDFIAPVTLERKREEARRLDALFRHVTGWRPVMWRSSLVGYGSYHYVYDSGRAGEMLATGFSPRKARHSIYIMPGYGDSKVLAASGACWATAASPRHGSICRSGRSLQALVEVPIAHPAFRVTTNRARRLHAPRIALVSPVEHCSVRCAQTERERVWHHLPPALQPAAAPHAQGTKQPRHL